MKCPTCDHKLASEEYMGMTVEKCPKCGGMWFDFKELDQLEDNVLLNDDMKGSIVWDKNPTDKKCPKCSEKMTQFNYRLDDLLLDYCEKNMHGYWIDKGEEERVIEEMKERVEHLERKYKVEEEWVKEMKRLQSPSFFSKLKDLLQ